jgi:flagellar motor switch protein FliG
LQRLLQKIGNYQTLARLALYGRSALALRKILLNVSERTGWIILSDLFEAPASQSDTNNTLLTFFEWLNALSLCGQIVFPIELQEKLIYPWLERNSPDSVLLKRLTLSMPFPGQ